MHPFKNQPLEYFFSNVSGEFQWLLFLSCVFVFFFFNFPIQVPGQMLEPWGNLKLSITCVYVPLFSFLIKWFLFVIGIHKEFCTLPHHHQPWLNALLNLPFGQRKSYWSLPFYMSQRKLDCALPKLPKKQIFAFGIMCCV